MNDESKSVIGAVVRIFLLLMMIFLPLFFAFGVKRQAVGDSSQTAVVRNVPRLSGYVTDLADVLSKKDEAYLTNLCKTLEKRTSIEFAVVTLNYLSEDGVSPASGSTSLEMYAHDLFNANGIGKKSKNNGLLFLVVTDDRKTRVEVGYGLEGQLNDGKVGRILDKNAMPFFKKGQYALGIMKTADAFAVELDKDILTYVANASSFHSFSVTQKDVVSSTDSASVSDSSVSDAKIDSDMDSLLSYKMLFPAFLFAFFVPSLILLVGFVSYTFFLLLLSGYPIFSVEIFNIFSRTVFLRHVCVTLGYWYAFLFVVLLGACILKVLYYSFWIRTSSSGGSSGGGSSSGGGFGGGSSGGGGASRGF